MRAMEDGASLRFVGSLVGQVNPDDLEKKRDQFSASMLGSRNESGIALYDQTFQKVEQIRPYSYTVPAEEMERIQRNVYTYFGTNEGILTNSFNEEEWNAYYESKVEPFAVQLGEGLSHMLFTQRERRGNSVMFSANRMQYMSSPSKRNMIRDMLDRGVMSINEARSVLQLPPVEGGDVRVLRGEYYDAASPKGDSDPVQRDETKKESDEHGGSDADGLD